MRPLSYSRAGQAEEAVAIAIRVPGSAFLAGGTTEVDLIRAGIERAEAVGRGRRDPSRRVHRAGCDRDR